MEQHARTIRLVGEQPIEVLKNKKVLLFGLGGVGSFVLESLCRLGVGHFVLVDHDVIDCTNINRQLYALHSTIGQKKIDIAKQRCLDINPNCIIDTYDAFYLPDQDLDYLFEGCHFVVDAIDTVSAKLSIVEKCHELSIPLITSLGTGNKLNPSLFEITTIDKTSVCPLAKVMRKELKERNLSKAVVLYSKELPYKGSGRTPGSISFVPSSAGLKIASYVYEQLGGQYGRNR